MVGPEVKRDSAVRVVERFEISRRRACRILSLHRSTLEYKPKRQDDEEVKAKMKMFASKYRRFGRPRIHNELRKSGLKINHKKTARLYRKLALQLKYRKGKKRHNVIRIPRPRPTKPNEVWSIDFMFDRFENGRRMKILTVVDDFSKEIPDLLIDTSITGHHLVRFFDSMKTLPKRLKCDNGTEFWSKAFMNWAESRGIQIDFIEPGKPNQNAFIESLNSRIRDECLNENLFQSPEHARGIILGYKDFYNRERPHSSLSYRTPKEFGDEQRSMLTP